MLSTGLPVAADEVANWLAHNQLATGCATGYNWKGDFWLATSSQACGWISYATSWLPKVDRGDMLHGCSFSLRFSYKVTIFICFDRKVKMHVL